MRTLIAYGIVGLVAVGLLAGCGGGSDGPETVPATGIVTMNDSPIEGASVVFTSEDGGLVATGTTDSEGEFKLVTGSGQGAVVGKHTVSITHMGAVSESNDPSQMAKMNSKKNPVPKKYADATTSQLTAEVTADGENHFPFDLKK